MAKDKYSIKSFILPHFANSDKQQQLWNLYSIYKHEFVFHTKSYFKNFLANQIISKFTIPMIGGNDRFWTTLNNIMIK